MIKGAVLGGDVSKSRSPAIHQAAFAALGVEGTYEAFSVDARDFRPLVKRLRAEGYRYLNVTIPHKRAAADLAEVASPNVRTTRAANTLLLRPASVRGENTDGYGLLAALEQLGAPVRAGQVVTVVGAGGAAAGAIAALLMAGARLRLTARRPRTAHALRRQFSMRARARIEVFTWTGARLAQAVADAAVLISAVPAMAWSDADARAGLAGLPRSAAVLEMAYGGRTPLATAARLKVGRYQDGLPMLVHQAARAVQLALGRLPPSEPLLRAARAL